FAVDIRTLSTFKDKAKDNHTLSIADTTHLPLTCLQVLGRVYHLPDVMLTFAPEIKVTLNTRQRFQENGEQRPDGLPGIAHRKVKAGNQLPGNGADLHGRGF